MKMPNGPQEKRFIDEFLKRVSSFPSRTVGGEARLNWPPFQSQMENHKS